MVQIPGAVGEAKAAGSDTQPALQQTRAGTPDSDRSLRKIHVYMYTHTSKRNDNINTQRATLTIHNSTSLNCPSFT